MATRIYPALEGVGWRYKWGGRAALTPDHTPRLFKLADRVHAGLGFNGRGVAMGSMFGVQLTRAVLGEETDMPIEPIDVIPNHAFRQFGLTWFLVTGRLLDRGDAREAPPAFG